MLPPPHAWPHAPQLLLSVIVFVHAPEQYVVPDEHVQTPALQALPPVQATPQAPQLELLVWRLTQTPLQLV